MATVSSQSPSTQHASSPSNASPQAAGTQRSAVRRDGRSRRNVARAERWVSAAVGGLLTYAGARRGWLGLLGLGSLGGALLYRGITGHSPVYERLGVNTAETEVAPVEVSEAVTVQKSPQEVYEFWRDVERFPRFMRHLESVEDLGDNRSRWTARAPGDLTTLTWEAEITEDKPGEQIAWRSLPGADVANTGSVRFSEAPKGGATETRIQISYHPSDVSPGGGLAAQLLNPAFEQLVKEDARRFKHLLETGEVPTIEGQPQGR